MTREITVKKQVISWVVSILVGLVIMLFPVSETFTPEIRMYLAITIGTVLLIILDVLPKMFIAIMLPTLYTVTNLAPMATSFAAYAAANLWMVLGALFLGKIMEDTGVLNRICYRLIIVMGGAFSGAVFGAFVATLVINWVTFGAGWVVALPVVLGLIKAMDLKPGKESALICFAGCAGAIDSGVAWFIPQNKVMYDSFVQLVEPEYGGVQFFTPIAYNWFTYVACVLCIVVLLWLYKRDGKKNGSQTVVAGGTKEHFQTLLDQMGKMSTDEIKALVLFVIILAGCIASTWTGLNSTYLFMIVPYLSFLPVIGFNKVAKERLRNLNFDGIFFAVSCLAIGNVGNLVGFNTWFVGLVTPMLSGKGLLFACLVMFAIIMIGNFALTPGALLASFGSPFVSIADLMGMAPVASLFLLNYAGNAIFLPHEITGYLILFGMGYWPMKDFVKGQAIKSVVYLVGFICIMFPLWKIMGLV